MQVGLGTRPGLCGTLGRIAGCGFGVLGIAPRPGGGSFRGLGFAVLKECLLHLADLLGPRLSPCERCAGQLGKIQWWWEGRCLDGPQIAQDRQKPIERGLGAEFHRVLPQRFGEAAEMVLPFQSRIG